MIDSGKTLKFLKAEIEKLEPKTVEITTLIYRPNKIKDFDQKFIGFPCEHFYLAGRGLDYNHYGRFHTAIYAKNE